MGKLCEVFDFPSETVYSHFEGLFSAFRPIEIWDPIAACMMIIFDKKNCDIKLSINEINSISIEILFMTYETNTQLRE